MNGSVDYQIELHLKDLEDELKLAEQRYLEKIQLIVAKYTSRASQLREQVSHYNNHCLYNILTITMHQYLVIKRIWESFEQCR